MSNARNLADLIASGGVIEASEIADSTITGGKLASDITISTTGSITSGGFTSSGNITLSGTNQLVFNTNGSIKFSTTSGETGIVLNNASTEDIYIKTNGDADIILKTNNTERVRVDSSGNVGIGTSSPVTEFEVVGTIKSDDLHLGNTTSSSNGGILHIKNNDGGSSDAGGVPKILVQGGNNGAFAVAKLEYYGDAGMFTIGYANLLTDRIVLNGGHSSYNASIHLYNGSGVQNINIGAETHTYFNTTANFGIGTTSPSYKFHVVGNAYISTDLTVANDLTVSNDLTVTGNLTINGTTTTVNSTNTQVTDNLLELNSGATANTNDAGIIIERGTTGDNAIMAWDESADQFIFGTTTATASDTGNLTITAGNISVSDITSSGDINLADDSNLYFGTDNDLRLFHESASGNSYIYHGTTSPLYIRTDKFRLTNKLISESMIQADANGEVRLYYDNSEKLNTSATGVTVSGTIELGDGHQLGNDTTYDNLVIKSSTDESIILSLGGTGQFIIRTGSTTLDDGTNIFRMDGSGNVGIGGNIPSSYNQYADNLVVGTTSGENGITIASGTGNSGRFIFSDNTTSSADAFRGGIEYSHTSDGMFFYTNGSTERMRIDSSGNVGIGTSSPSQKLEVSGNILLGDNNNLYLGTSGDLAIYHDGSNSYIKDQGTGDLRIIGDNNVDILNSTGNKVSIRCQASSAVNLYYDNSNKLQTTSTGINVTGTVTATAFSGDGSGLTGVSSVGGATGVSFNDSVKAQFGASNDLQIYHNGTNSVIDEQGTGQLLLRSNGDGIFFQNGDSTASIASFRVGTGNEFFYNGVKKLETISGGVKVTGNLQMDDSNYITLGTSQDLQIFHSGANSHIYDAGTGALNLSSDGTDIRLTKHTGGEMMLVAVPDGAVSLYYDNSKKLQTNSVGVDITGHLVPNSSNTFDLGTSSLVWRNIYTSDFHMSNEGLDKGNDIDGTKGSWTFQEGEENLYLINNKNGKKYKFNLTEIE